MVAVSYMPPVSGLVPRQQGVGEKAHWWVLTMAWRLIFPLSIAFFTTGATLQSEISTVLHGQHAPRYSLRRAGRVDNDRILSLLIRHQVGVVVTGPYPYIQCQLWLHIRSTEGTYRKESTGYAWRVC